MSLKLELKHLNAIHAVAQTGNGTHAARLLSISQSALSHRLHEAGRRLGVKLYRQAGKRLVLTAEGERLDRAAAGCLEELRRAERDIELSRNHVEHVVRLGSTIYGSFYWLPKLIRALRSGSASIEIEVVCDVSPNLVELVNAEKIDIAIVTGAVKTRKLKSAALYRDELLVFLPAHHPKAKNAHFLPRDFQDEVFVTETPKHESLGPYRTVFERLGASPSRIMRVGHREAAMALVGSGLGITIETRQNSSAFKRNKDVAALPITSAGLYAEYYVVYAKQLPRESPVHTVTTALMQVIGSE